MPLDALSLAPPTHTRLPADLPAGEVRRFVLALTLVGAGAFGLLLILLAGS